jgi:hypothetical protein
MVFELIKVGDDLYTVERKILESKGVNVDDFKSFTKCTNVFRRDGLLYFCRIVDEAQIVEDEPTKQIEQSDLSLENQ